MLERDMYKELEKACKNEYGADYMLQKIESSLTGVGIPDIAYTFNSSKSGWIELKVAKIIKTGKNKGKINVPYRPGQQNWLKKHKSLSRRTFCLIYLEGTYYLCNKGFEKEYKNILHLEDNCCHIADELDTDFIMSLYW